MGQLTSCCRDARERGCWSAILYPKKAPKWYAALLGGLSSGASHLEPAPEGSLHLLGHISLSVPELDKPIFYWVENGFEAGRSVDEVAGQELRVNVGASQLRFPLRPGADAQSWPGTITLWVDDIRRTTDMFNVVQCQLGRVLVSEYTQSESGGEYALKLEDPFGRPFLKVSEAPSGYADKIRKLGRGACRGDTESAPKEFNLVAINDVSVPVPSRQVMDGVVRFYNHFLLAGVKGAGPSQYSVALHFGPGDGLHQTLTFRQDPTGSLKNMGEICMYVAEHHQFVRAYARCKSANLLLDPKDREEVDRACEFKIKGIYDPDRSEVIIALPHVIRHSGHPECPIR
mmetsp:Transcript_60531/g.131161  ORF Transcript_60531/g.131161 Transcript_60531/m.131161 type:complete len:344 (-) Transcript_60531:74-1105(-)